MRVALVVSGSHGDVQPMVALGLGSEAAGHVAIGQRLRAAANARTGDP
jgi:hypothetical protein